MHYAMYEYVKYIYPEILKIISELIIVFLLIRYRYKHRISELKLSKEQIEKIIDDFVPDDFVPNESQDHNVKKVECLYELADFDVFDLKHENKDAIKDTIMKYGIGTCGPRGFYGTLDLHLSLEKQICDIFDTESSVLYPNGFTCVNSVISCFCKQYDIVFYHKDSNEAIIRGISISKACTVSFGDLMDLRQKILRYRNPKKRNFVVTEALFKNTGAITDLCQLIRLKKEFKLWVILDETYSFPIMGSRGVSTYFCIDSKEIDIIIGSFSHYLCSSGAFSTGIGHIMEYQRLSAQAYCFSASLPGVLTMNAMQNLHRRLDTTKARKVANMFRRKFTHAKLVIMSSVDSPVIIITKKSIYDEYVQNLDICMSYSELEAFRNSLIRVSVRAALVENPIPAIRICLKARYSKKEIDDILLRVKSAADTLL
eukprot:jgi/Antlo1/414/902